MFKKEKYKQIIFIVLVVSGTIVLYCSETLKDKSISLNRNNGSELVIKNKDAELHFGIFMNNPESKEGIDAFFKTIIYWDQSDNDSSIQAAMEIFESKVIDDSLKNIFYSRLGKYYLAVNRKSNTKTIEKLNGKFGHSLRANRFPVLSKENL